MEEEVERTKQQVMETIGTAGNPTNTGAGGGGGGDCTDNEPCVEGVEELELRDL